ncbi:GNAT family N-acetyltransferase [Anaerosphaera multitolerans]|uniref:GNAT family N-acetyltransferase n=1 Tax=Anaerosphaera multitolerans TaxID=2487351 RepID=A0A437S761_9FIRM|nr:GNAT family N-acetyltransferase [Anaerosphaera multitolerans]RVU54811.1 GNAT family N-acetyltransferase [Anaerosphaera multitolerans]
MKSLVKNKEEFNILLNKFLTKEFINNGNRLIRDYKKLIEENRLCYVESDEYLFVYEDCGKFYNLYYFINRDCKKVSIDGAEFNKTIVFDEIYKGDFNNFNIVDLFLNLGFEKYLSRRYKVLNLSKKEAVLPREVTFAKLKDLDTILDLQKNYIDRYTGNVILDLPMSEAIKNKEVLTIEKKGEVLAYLRFTKDKKTVTLEGIAVNENHRGEGYSKKLMEYFINYFSTGEYRKIDLWVRDDNIGAIKLYDFFKFEDGKYICDNYIKF